MRDESGYALPEALVSLAIAGALSLSLLTFFASANEGLAAADAAARLASDGIRTDDSFRRVIRSWEVPYWSTLEDDLSGLELALRASERGGVITSVDALPGRDGPASAVRVTYSLGVTQFETAETVRSRGFGRTVR